MPPPLASQGSLAQAGETVGVQGIWVQGKLWALGQDPACTPVFSPVEQGIGLGLVLCGSQAS